MTKTKEVDVHNSAAQLFFASPKERRVHLRQKMESCGEEEGSDSGQQQPAVRSENTHTPGNKKKTHRAPSPARPKDVPGWSLTKIRGGIGTPTLSVKPGSIHLGSRMSRRSPRGSVSGKDDRSERSGGKPAGKASISSKASATKSSSRRKVSDASIASDDLSRDSGCTTGKLSPTDSSSELSDCASEENKLSTDNQCSDAESRSGADGHRARQPAASNNNLSADYKERLSVGAEAGEGSVSPGDERSVTSFDSRVPASSSLAFSDLTEEYMDGMQEEFVREIEELRSENDYLKDELEEVRSEMLEMRDQYVEEDSYQQQELRLQLEQANKTCRILQYRLRKAERRSLRVAQTGQVDGELIRSLEQDVKVAKDVSIRLHSQLDSVEHKRSSLDQENQELRGRLQELEVARQVLQQEVDKNSQKKRGARPNNKPDKKLSQQGTEEHRSTLFIPPPDIQYVTKEDSSDLKCQLHFAKEESALMCKKLSRLVKDSEAMLEELAKYRSLYGDVTASLTVEQVADSPHTREAEIRVHLKLVEEEANLLSRRMVELEVENRGLRAEMDDMKHDGPQELMGVGGGLGVGLGRGAMLLGGGASSENVMELQRHLQFVEEEAELLRRSLMEMEEQNKLLMNEMNRYKSELPPPPSMVTNDLESLSDGLLNESHVHPAQEGAVLISTDAPAQEEELRLARLQVGELGGKVKKLQYENRVLVSKLQRCDLASYHSSSSSSSSSLPLAPDTDPEAGDSAQGVPISPPHRKEPVGGEQDALGLKEGKTMEDNTEATAPLPGHLGQRDQEALLAMRDQEALLAMRDQARLVSTAIQLLTCPESTCLSSSPSIHHKAAESCDTDRPHGQISELSELAERPLVGALTSRLQALHTQLQAFVEQVDIHGKPQAGSRDPRGEAASAPSSPSSGDQQDGLNGAEEKQPGSRDQPESDVKGPDERSSQSELSDERQGEAHSNKKAVVRRELQLASLQPKAWSQERVVLLQQESQRVWSQERAVLLQESQHLKQALLLLSLKLRCFLKHWRTGCRMDSQWTDILEMNSLKDLYLLLEEENVTSPAHQSDKRPAADQQALSPTIKTSAVSSTLADLKVALQELSGELRQERQGSQELTQQFAKAKASWEVERTELQSLITQLESRTGKAAAQVSSEALEPPDLKVALKREHLLAESYAAVMDLTKQVQLGERNWSREKLELLDRFSQERAQWEARLREAKSKSLGDDPSVDTNGAGSPRSKSTSELDGPEVNGGANQEAELHLAVPPVSIGPELGDLTRKNWTYLTNETPEVGDTCRTWDGPSGSTLLGSEPDLRSSTAPDRSTIRIYYSPPAARRMEHRHRAQEAPEGSLSCGLSSCPDRGLAAEASYEQWLSSLSQQHRELLESRSSSMPSGVNSAHSPVDGRAPPAAFSLDMGEISANLSDDMKEMTNCVRQAIRSSSLERKSPKEPGTQVCVSTRATQTASLCVSIGLQTDTRGGCLTSKAWSPRPSPTTSTLASVRTRQISTSLDKVHSRIDRPCCSPKYGSPKLQRRVSSGSTSRLEGRERSLWSLQQRAVGGSGGSGGSAWARSTTTRDSPVLSGLTDGLSSLFSVVEHCGSTESLWRADTGASPARQPAAGRPSAAAVCGAEPAPQRYLVQDLYSRAPAGGPGSGDRALRDPPGSGVVAAGSGGVDEPKTECVSGLGGGSDSASRTVTKRFTRQTAGEHMVTIMGGGKEPNAAGSGMEDAPCDCVGQSSCSGRPQRGAARHSLGQCKHRPLEAPIEDKGDGVSE